MGEGKGCFNGRPRHLGLARAVKGLGGNWVQALTLGIGWTHPSFIADRGGASEPSSGPFGWGGTGQTPEHGRISTACHHVPCPFNVASARRRCESRLRDRRHGPSLAAHTCFVSSFLSWHHVNPPHTAGAKVLRRCHCWARYLDPLRHGTRP